VTDTTLLRFVLTVGSGDSSTIVAALLEQASGMARPSNIDLADTNFTDGFREVAHADAADSPIIDFGMHPTDDHVGNIGVGIRQLQFDTRRFAEE
jgi:hypothetical protein